MATTSAWSPLARRTFVPTVRCARFTGFSLHFHRQHIVKKVERLLSSTGGQLPLLPCVDLACRICCSLHHVIGPESLPLCQCLDVVRHGRQRHSSSAYTT